MSAIDPWAEIARLQKELDAAVAYHDECAELIESALGSDARKYREGSDLFSHYASDIRRIHIERDQADEGLDKAIAYLEWFTKGHEYKQGMMRCRGCELLDELRRIRQRGEK